MKKILIGMMLFFGRICLGSNIEFYQEKKVLIASYLSSLVLDESGSLAIVDYLENKYSFNDQNLHEKEFAERTRYSLFMGKDKIVGITYSFPKKYALDRSSFLDSLGSKHYNAELLKVSMKNSHVEMTPEEELVLLDCIIKNAKKDKRDDVCNFIVGIKQQFEDENKKKS